LVQDLKQRGLLESTLLVWGGEFGRTPIGQFGGRMRPTTRVATIMRLLHHVAGGRRHPERRGRSAVPTTWDCRSRRPGPHQQSASDYSALSGTGSHALTYRHMGRDFRLTDVRGTVVRKMLA